MPDDASPTPAAVLDHTDARAKAQIAKLQATFADSLVDAFHTLVTQSARAEEGSPLATLTLAQLDELLDCLHASVTQTPPDIDVLVPPDTPREDA